MYRIKRQEDNDSDNAESESNGTDTGQEVRKTEENMIIEFKAVLLAILDFLEQGETERAINYIRKVLEK